MSALFDEPIKARHVQNEAPVLWIGIVDPQPNELPKPGRLLVADEVGGLHLLDIGDLVIDWYYGYDPAKGAMGWQDKVHEGEERTIPEPPGIDLEGLDDDS